MLIKDVVYGEVEIIDRVLVDLIESLPLQRLKGVSQHGLPFIEGCVINRFDHSVGVMIVLRKLGASVEEQVAGLLHDVSHTAFSHAADWIFGGLHGEESFQDNILVEFVYKSEIPSILEKHGFDVKVVLDPHKFSLLEQSRPDLCADRVDYTLREFANDERKKDVSFLVDSLTVDNGMIVFNSEKAANLFSIGFLKCQTEHWDGDYFLIKNYVFIEMLKLALKKGIMVKEDFFLDDDSLLQKLFDSKDEEVLKELEYLESGVQYDIVEKSSTFTRRNKFRFVDPLFFDGKMLVRLGSVDKEFKNFLENTRKRSKNELHFVLT